MQFHLDGFRPGDPRVSSPVESGSSGIASDETLSDEAVDVLIVGSGPAGLTLAAQLSAFPSISTRIIESKPGPMQKGQADGVACRSVEMFEAFGFADELIREAYWVNEVCFWRPDPDQPENIVRVDRIQDVEDDLSEFPHVILNQARIHDYYLEVMERSARRLVPDYSHRLADLKIDGSGETVTATVDVLEPGNAAPDAPIVDTTTIQARYVVGCDGARSVVRSALGHELRGDSANKLWGVMDVLAVTDFPDMRLKCAIQSADQGSVLIIPREGGYMIRIYTEVGSLAKGERARDRGLTSDQLIDAAQRIMHPYSLDVKEVAWWSAYEIGQRLTDSFDDVPAAERGTRSPRVFITGDACHTHSPKAGQGMNVSMADSFNLGWKLAAVLEGRSHPNLLDTYSEERQAVAAELIDFDRDMARLFSLRASEGEAAPDSLVDGASGEDPEEQAIFQDYFAKHLRYTAGVETSYGQGMLTGPADHQHLAVGQVIGKRFHSAPVIRLADAKPVELAHVVKADGRWRLMVFADRSDPADPDSPLAALCRFLEDDPTSPVPRFTSVDAAIDSVIDVRAVFQQYHRDVALERTPALLRPTKGRYGLTDYEKMFCSPRRSGVGDDREIHEARGIDRDRGCVIIVRPDQYVAHVLPLDAHAELAAFFEPFMVPAG